MGPSQRRFVLVAVLLNKVGDWVNAQQLHPYIGYGLGALEFFLFALDIVLFVVFELKEAYILAHSILYGPRRRRTR
jgi:hypothetical protein